MPDPALVSRLYRSLNFIRRMEERIAEIYPEDKIKSPVHLAIGQESVSVGVCDVLGAEDVVSGTYRSHALYLAKGGDPGAMMAEMYGKQTGCAAGKGGSMHLVGMARNILGTSAVVGTHIPISLGFALEIKQATRANVVGCFFGDGATEEGVFYESLNFAALRNLPVLFVCENNGYAIHTPLAKRWGSEDLCARVAGFGVPTVRIEDGDVFAIREAAGEAVKKIRGGSGPQFIECLVYRWREHVGPNEDYDVGYRSLDEVAPWKKNDQVARLAAMVDDAERAAIDAEIEKEIGAAVAFAEESPVPEEKELWNNVFAD